MKSLLIACDFDGTITVRDTLRVINGRFGTPGVWSALQPGLRSGAITVEQAMEEEFRGVTATWDEVRALVLAEAPVRDGFGPFVEWARGEGHRLLVLSNGFRSVIDLVLGQAGLADLEIVSHEARFSREGCRLIWSDRGEPCAVCSRRCKRHDISVRLAGETLVYVGDGISDRCAARMAQIAFARDGLAEDLAGDGVPYIPFDDFFQVRRALEPLAAAA